MKKTILILSAILLSVSCSEIIEPLPIETIEESVPEGFRWETMEYKSLELINDGINVYNGNGDMVASNVSRGTYYFAVNSKDTIIGVTDTKIYLSSPSRAAATAEGNIYFPAKNSFASFMADSEFPAEADGCFNDIVFGYNIEYTLDNSNGSISKMVVTIAPDRCSTNAAVALKFRERNIKIASVNGNNIANGGLFSQINENGTESGQGSCIVVPLSNDLSNSDLVRIEILFEEGNRPYYETLLPYINSTRKSGGVSLFVAVEERGKEIFTKGNSPSDKFDYSLFAIAGQKDFSSSSNAIWALSLEESISSPKANNTMIEAYPMMKEWIFSSGSKHSDWFKNPVSSLTF